MRGRQSLAETLADVPEDDDDLNAEEQEALEETLVDDATAAQTVAELESEIRILSGLEQQAKAVVASGQDRKWDELSKMRRRCLPECAGSHGGSVDRSQSGATQGNVGNQGRSECAACA